MLGDAQRGLDHVQIMDLSWIHIAQAFRQEICLLLVVPLDVHIVSRTDHRFQQCRRIRCIYGFPFFEIDSGALHPFRRVLASCVPVFRAWFDFHTS